jgi:hypothetical protein
MIEIFIRCALLAQLAIAAYAIFPLQWRLEEADTSFVPAGFCVTVIWLGLVIRCLSDLQMMVIS